LKEVAEVKQITRRKKPVTQESKSSTSEEISVPDVEEVMA
jgi:hypothetical protein